MINQGRLAEQGGPVWWGRYGAGRELGWHLPVLTGRPQMLWEGNLTMATVVRLPQDCSMEEPVVGATAESRSQQHPEIRH